MGSPAMTMQRAGTLKRRRNSDEEREFRVVVRPLAAKVGGYWVSVPGDLAALCATAAEKLGLVPYRLRDAVHLAVIDDVSLLRDEMVVAVTTYEDECARFGLAPKEADGRARPRRE
jgi:hypothetical protein